MARRKGQERSSFVKDGGFGPAQVYCLRRVLFWGRIMKKKEVGMDSHYNGPDRRKGVRANTNFLVLYDFDPRLKVRLTIKRKIFNAIAKNLSEIGMAILTNIDLPPNISANLSFNLYNNAEADPAKRVRQIAVDCRTCYCFLLPDGAFQVGLRFLNLTEGDRSYIAKYVKDFAGKQKADKESRTQARPARVGARRRQD